MKLYLVNCTGYSNDYSYLMIAENYENIIDKAWKKDDQCYSIYAIEINEVDGYIVKLERRKE